MSTTNACTGEYTTTLAQMERTSPTRKRMSFIRLITGYLPVTIGVFSFSIDLIGEPRALIDVYLVRSIDVCEEEYEMARRAYWAITFELDIFIDKLDLDIIYFEWYIGCWASIDIGF